MFNSGGCGSCHSSDDFVKVIGVDCKGVKVTEVTPIVTCAILEDALSSAKVTLSGEVVGLSDATKVVSIAGATSINSTGVVSGKSITDGIATLTGGGLSGLKSLSVTDNIELGVGAKSDLLNDLILSGQVTGALNNTVVAKTAQLDVTSLATTGDVTVGGKLNLSQSAKDSLSKDLATASTSPAMGTSSSISENYIGGGNLRLGEPAGWFLINGKKVAYYE
jgi:hypothetical protein